MNKYNYDKNLAKQLPVLTKEELQTGADTILNYLEKQKKDKYVMLLSNNLKYYTIFTQKTLVSTKTGLANEIIGFIAKNCMCISTGKSYTITEQTKRNF
jgi:hypothetical protein